MTQDTSCVIHVTQIQVVEMKRDWQPDDIMFCGITGTHPNDLNIKQRICDMEDVKMCHQAINVSGTFLMNFPLSLLNPLPVQTFTS